MRVLSLSINPVCSASRPSRRWRSAGMGIVPAGLGDGAATPTVADAWSSFGAAD
jgi:hypothetical protein